MTYATTNPPTLIAQRIGSGPALWSYSSTDDDTTVNGANYFSNGVALGMAVGDVVLVTDTTTPKVSLHGVASVTSTAATTAFGAVA
jgi:hypothetical protein